MKGTVWKQGVVLPRHNMRQNQAKMGKLLWELWEDSALTTCIVQIWPDLHYSCVNRILQGLKETYMLLWGHVKWIMVWLVIYRAFYLENRRGSSLSKESLDCYPKPYRTLRLLAAIPCWTNALWSVTRSTGPQLPALAGAAHGSPVLRLLSQVWGQGDHAQVPPWQYGHSWTTVYI